MLRRITAKELTELEAYFQLEPFGPHAVNLNAGLVAATYANVHRKKGATAFMPQTFALGDYALPPAEPQTSGEQKGVIQQIMTAFKGVRKKRGRKES